MPAAVSQGRNRQQVRLSACSRRCEAVKLHRHWENGCATTAATCPPAWPCDGKSHSIPGPYKNQTPGISTRPSVPRHAKSGDRFSHLATALLTVPGTEAANSTLLLEMLWVSWRYLGCPAAPRVARSSWDHFSASSLKKLPVKLGQGARWVRWGQPFREGLTHQPRPRGKLYHLPTSSLADVLRIH